MSNKNLCMFLVSRNGNNILIWIWNNSMGDDNNMDDNVENFPSLTTELLGKTKIIEMMKR